MSARACVSKGAGDRQFFEAVLVLFILIVLYARIAPRSNTANEEFKDSFGEVRIQFPQRFSLSRSEMWWVTMDPRQTQHVSINRENSDNIPRSPEALRKVRSILMLHSHDESCMLPHFEV